VSRLKAKIIVRTTLTVIQGGHGNITKSYRFSKISKTKGHCYDLNLTKGSLKNHRDTPGHRW
jgi:hypothetical protein